MTVHIDDVLLMSTIEETKCGDVVSRVFLCADGTVKYSCKHLLSSVYVDNMYSYAAISDVGAHKIAEGMINKLVKEMMSPPDTSE